MKIIRFLDSTGQVRYGDLQPDGTALLLEGELGALQKTGEKRTPGKILAPIEPASILCIGLNYRDHATETKGTPPEYPILFMKAPSSAQNPGDPILIPTHQKSERVDYECELAVVIGKSCKNVSREKALEYVLGYTCANDVSARDWQIKYGGTQWCKGKTFDTFCPLGPVLVTADEIPHPDDLNIRTILNGEVMQNSSTANMIFDVPTLISFLSGSTTLRPGTVILTGTPSGVGMAREPKVWLKPGDIVTIEISGIGQLTNPVALES